MRFPSRDMCLLSELWIGLLFFITIIIIVMGLGMSGWIPLGRIFGDYYRPDGIIVRSFRKLSGIQSTTAFFPLGLVLGLMSCGPVYTG
jgi:sulfite exporter TauE/SafE